MAFMNQERKKEIMQKVKAVTPKSWKITARVRDHSEIKVIIRQIPKADFLDMLYHDEVDENDDIITVNCSPFDDEKKLLKKDFQDANTFRDSFYIMPSIAEISFNKIKRINKKSKTAIIIKKMMMAIDYFNHDKSDPMTDYFNVGYYCDLSFGDYNNPCKLI